MSCGDDDASHRGAPVDGKHDFDVVPVGEPPHGVTDAAHGVAVALSPVQGEQNPPRAAERHGVLENACMLHRPEEGIDHGIAGYENPVVRHTLRAEVGGVPLGRTEVEGRQPGDEPAVGLFGERRPLIARA